MIKTQRLLVHRVCIKEFLHFPYNTLGPANLKNFDLAKKNKVGILAGSIYQHVECGLGT